MVATCPCEMKAMSSPGTRPWSRKILKSVSEGMTPDWKISSPMMLPKGWTADLMYIVQYSSVQYSAVQMNSGRQT